MAGALRWAILTTMTLSWLGFVWWDHLRPGASFPGHARVLREQGPAADRTALPSATKSTVRVVKWNAPVTWSARPLQPLVAASMR